MKFFAIALALAGAAAGQPSAAPQSADAILQQAKTEAAANHRAVWVIFHASW